MPLHRRLPKRGFSNWAHKLNFVALNVCELQRLDEGATVDLDALQQARLVSGHDVRVKIVGDGELSKNLIVKASRIARKGIRPERSKADRRSERIVVSSSAAEKIKAAGGSVEVS